MGLGWYSVGTMATEHWMCCPSASCLPIHSGKPILVGWLLCSFVQYTRACPFLLGILLVPVLFLCFLMILPTEMSWQFPLILPNADPFYCFSHPPHPQHCLAPMQQKSKPQEAGCQLIPTFLSKPLGALQRGQLAHHLHRSKMASSYMAAEMSFLKRGKRKKMHRTVSREQESKESMLHPRLHRN